MRVEHLTAALLLTSTFFLFSHTSTVRGDIYSYRDENGVLHLSNDPRLKKKAELIMKETPSGFVDSADTFKIIGLIERISQEEKIDPCLVKAIARAESSFNPRAVSPKGAIGVMQLMPDTAARFNVKDAYNPEENITGGIRYLKLLLEMFPGNLKYVIAAYNAGENRVKNANGIPKIAETQIYVDRVILFYNEYKKKAGVGRPVKSVTDENGNIYLTNMF